MSEETIKKDKATKLAAAPDNADAEEITNAELKSLVLKLASKVLELQGQGPQHQTITEGRRLAEKTREKIRHQEQLIREANERLEAGPLKFECEISNEPRSKRVVGGRSEFEAKEKYHTFFSIRSFIQPDVSIVVKPMRSASPVAAV